MSKLVVLSVVLAVALLGTTEGLKCNEGFNVSLGGIPFYHWSERTCTANSKCFGQELVETVGVDVAMTYGACISSAYADLLNCDKLFGPDSDFDPAKLLDLIPEVEKRLNDLVADFVKGGLQEVINVFTADGKSTETFVAGILKFYENLGLNMEKVKPLQPSLAKLLKAAFNASMNPTAQDTAVQELLKAIGELDTDNTEFETDVYNFIGNFISEDELNNLKNNPAFAPLIKKLPGLGKSIFPASWESEKWYDLTFKILGDIDIKNAKQSTINAINTIKATFNIPSDVLQILDPLFNALPDLIDELAKGNGAYAGTWSLELLKKYSERDDATKMFDSALISFIGNITGVADLQEELKTMIRWLPGLMYKFIPAERAKIEEVYKKMANGFNAFNWADLTKTSPATKLSEFVFLVIEKASNGTAQTNAVQQALVNNFSYMFYDLMSDYTTELDKFFTVLINGFSSWPNINAGKMISDIIVELGETVPPEVKPLLDNLQGVLTASMAQPFNLDNLIAAFKTVTDAYKSAFPNSPFPELVQRYINIIKDLVTVDFTQPDAQTKYMQIQLELIYWQIDYQFAIFNAMDFSKDEFAQMLIDAFPQYGALIKVMQNAKAEDVKQLVKDIVAWASSGDVTTTTFVSATKPTIEKITASLTSVMKDIRAVFQPKSCKYGACETDHCNSHTYISTQEPLTKPTTTTKAPTNAPDATTSGAPATFSYSFLLNIAAMWLACKALFG